MYKTQQIIHMCRMQTKDMLMCSIVLYNILCYERQSVFIKISVQKYLLQFISVYHKYYVHSWQFKPLCVYMMLD
jgi:hypothetical protein